MRFRRESAGIWMGSVRALVSGVLCVLMVEQPMAAAAVTKPGTAAKQIQGDERVLHALNRFTFGPRPGDVAAVKAMEVRQWFEQQLNPSGIDDSGLEERLGLVSALEVEGGG